MSQEQELEFRKRSKRILLPTYLKAERSETIIQGPLFGWPFPLLNAILQLIYATRERAPPQAYFPRTATRRVEYIRDSLGRIVEKYEEIEVA